MRVASFPAFMLLCQMMLHPRPEGYGQQKVSIGKVVIDPGHGGNDPGTIGRRAKEKNINLAIALKLGNMIQRNMKDVRVIYTRDKDVFVELDRRSEIANDARADLFISIHCNANHVKSLHGAETYVMGLHRSQANLEIAKLENASILLESDYSARYQGFDPNSDESYITFSLFQDAYLGQSMEFAAEVQKQLDQRVGLNNRGVRQAGFLVLYKTTMPSVLIECGYLSNTTEENFLITDKGQEFIASAIFKALKNFREQLEGSLTRKEDKTPVSSAKPDNPPVKNQPKDTAPLVTKSSGNNPVAQNQNVSGELSFRVQIACLSTDIGTDAARFRGLGKVMVYRHGGMYKYTVGDVSSAAEAKRILASVRSKGFKDAFIVIFRNGERIPPEETRQLLEK